MLVITRKAGENVLIGSDIKIVVTRTDYDSVRLAISAPQNIPIFRGELVENDEELQELFQIKKSPPR